MHRTELLDLLDTYTPCSEDEIRTQEHFYRFIQENTSCFERSFSQGHVTGSAWILDKEKTHCLLTCHRKLDKWLQLGGHADGCPDVLETARREAIEESGIPHITLLSTKIFDIDIHLIPEHNGVPSHYHYDIRFLFEADRGKPLIVSDESHNLAWVEIKSLPKYTQERSVIRMAEKSFSPTVPN